MLIPKRYEGVSVNKTSTGKQYYASVIYPKIELDPTDIYTVVYENDRLDLLASKYYGDVRYWWILAEANNLGKGSFNVDTNTRLRIPQNLEKILNDYSTLNENR